MKQILFFTFLANIALTLYAFQVWGVILILLSSAGSYYLISNKFNNYKGLGEKAALGSVHILGIFAAHAILGNPIITLMIGIIEVVIFLIFSSSQ